MNATQIGELMRILDRIDKRLEIIAEQLTREKLTAATDTWAYSIPINSKPTYEKVDEREEALGAIAHEIGHLSRAALGHAAWEDDSPMQEWWDGLKRWGRNEFTAAEKAALLAIGDFG